MRAVQSELDGPLRWHAHILHGVAEEELSRHGVAQRVCRGHGVSRNFTSLASETEKLTIDEPSLSPFDDASMQHRLAPILLHGYLWQRQRVPVRSQQRRQLRRDPDLVLDKAEGDDEPARFARKELHQVEEFGRRREARV